MATGRKAYEGKSQASFIAAILKEQPRPIYELQPMTPPALDRVVRQSLAKDPDERWQTSGDLCRELRWIAETGSQAGIPRPVVARRKNRERFSWVLTAMALLAALAAVAAAARYAHRAAMLERPM